MQRVKDISQLHLIVLASCAAAEQSQFKDKKNKMMWFTYCLTEVVGNSSVQRPLSVQQAFEFSRQRMKQLLREGYAGREQEPQMTDTVLLPVILAP